MTKKPITLVLLLALASGCRALPRRSPSPDAAPAASSASAVESQREAAAVAAAMSQAGPGVDYKISPADLLSVTVYDVQGMNRKARVDGNGVIALPLIGAVKVGGKTLAGAQALIETKLEAFVVKPQVTLFVEDYGSKTFFVMGEVQKPGSYPIPIEQRVTVLEAISTAGGFTPVAAQDRARVLRTVNGESTTYTVDIRGITRDGLKEKDIVLQPNDVVYIPQSLF